MKNYDLHLVGLLDLINTNPTQIMETALHGHDPLIMNGLEDFDAEQQDIFETALKDSVHSILKCYTGFFDIFSEPIQNALDAVEKKYKQTENYTPKIWIDINIKDNSLRVVDNGCGMNLKEYKFCFRPSISYKRGDNLRGNKGVGATFLAYGYNYAKLQTKQNKKHYSAILRQGRIWVQDDQNKIPRPKFEIADFYIPELENEESGTSIEIILTGAENEKPKSLWWYSSSTAEQWFDVLRFVTPLGGIYLKSQKFSPTVYLRVTDKSGNVSEIEPQTKVEFYYPHDIPNIREKDLTEIRKGIDSINGDPKKKMELLPSKYRNLQCIWEIWDLKDLLNSDYLKLELTEEQIALMQKHDVSIYASQLDSLDTFKAFNEKTGMRGNIKVLKGGIQLATEGMPQGDLIPVALKRNSGLQEYTFIIVHFKSGNPDTGRKNFQPELKEIAEYLASKITAYIINYRELFRPDTGSTKNLDPDNDLYKLINKLVKYREANPIPYPSISKNFTYLSKPQEEQDVIAVFNQLIGVGVIRGIFIFSNSYNLTYDSFIELNYDESHIFDDKKNPLGVRNDIQLNEPYHPMALEYKYDFDALLRDFDNGNKYASHIKFVVCWKVSRAYKDDYVLKSLLIEKEGNTRTFFGATHQAFLPGKTNGDTFEVLILEDLINFLIHPDSEIATQKAKYGHI